VLGEGRIIVESAGLAQRRFDPSEHRHMTQMVSAAVFPASRAASVTRDLLSWRTSALTNDEVTLPVAALGSSVNLLGPIVDGDAILDGEGLDRRGRRRL
jgi:hypothetical protein